MFCFFPQDALRHVDGVAESLMVGLDPFASLDFAVV
jgi:hypothetical protein